MKAENSLSSRSLSGRLSLEDTLPVLGSSFQSLHASRRLVKSELTEGNSQFFDGRSKSIKVNEPIGQSLEAQATRKLTEIFKSTLNIIIEEVEIEEARLDLFVQETLPLSELLEERKEEDWKSSLSAEGTDQVSNRSTFKSEPFEERIYLTTFESSLAESFIKKEGSASRKALNDLLDDLSSLSDAHVHLLIQQNKHRIAPTPKICPAEFGDLETYLSPLQLKALASFQRYIRNLLLRKKFLRLLRMNAEFEQKKQYIKLKRSIRMYETARDTEFWTRYSMIISQLESDNVLRKPTI